MMITLALTVRNVVKVYKRHHSAERVRLPISTKASCIEDTQHQFAGSILHRGISSSRQFHHCARSCRTHGGKLSACWWTISVHLLIAFAGAACGNSCGQYEHSRSSMEGC